MAAIARLASASPPDFPLHLPLSAPPWSPKIKIFRGAMPASAEQLL
jgi:hypothetical protein